MAQYGRDRITRATSPETLGGRVPVPASGAGELAGGGLRRAAAAVPLGVGALAAAGLALLAAAWIVLPSAPAYDAWSWLVWGREIAALELDTSAGPSWKPLPPLIAVVLAPLGEAAPELWLGIVRVAWLASIVLAYRLAATLAARRAGGGASVPRIAGVLAAGAVVLLEDPQVPWLRHFANGLSEPLLVALVLGAVERHLSGRPRQAIALGALAALIRPEAWPLLALYALWAWRAHPATRLAGLVGLVAVATVPALWLGGDLLGSGAASTGGERARVDAVAGSLEEAVDRVVTMASYAFELPPPAAWLLAAAAALLALRRRDRFPLLLLSGAVAWAGLVVLERLAGYAALARFLLPAAAIACVLGAVRAAWLWQEARGRGPDAVPGRDRAIAAVALCVLALVTAPLVAERVGALGADLDGALARGELQDDLAATIAAGGGADRLGRCGVASIEDFLLVPALAWRLELSIAEVSTAGTAPRPRAGPTVTLAGSDLAEQLGRRSRADRRGAAGAFAVFWLPCEPGATRVSPADD